MIQPKTYKRTKPGNLALCLVFLVLLWCSGGTVVWNIARKLSYNYVRSHRSELKFTDTIVVSLQQLKGNSGLVWMKHDEIRFQGQMYDIRMQVPLADGTIMLVGHYDNWENKLFKSLEQLLDPAPGQAPQKEKRTSLWLADAILPPGTQPSTQVHSFVLQHFYKVDQAIHSTHKPDIPVPPPDAC